MWWPAIPIGIGFAAVLVWWVRGLRELEREDREAEARRVRFSRCAGQDPRQEATTRSLRQPRDAA